jgi:hypothetical protein
MGNKKYLFLFASQFAMLLLIKLVLIYITIIQINQDSLEEVNKIKTHLDSILKEDAKFITIVEKKISKDYLALQNSNKLPFYLSLIALDENNTFNEGAYIFISKSKKLISHLGISSITSLPIDDLILLTNTNPQAIHYRVYDSSLITVKKLATSQSNEEEPYIIIRSNLHQITKKLTQQLAIQNPYFIRNLAPEQTALADQGILKPLNSELTLFYQNKDTFSIIKPLLLSREWLTYVAFWMLASIAWIILLLINNKKHSSRELALQKTTSRLLNSNNDLQSNIMDIGFSYKLEQDLYESLIQSSSSYPLVLDSLMNTSEIRRTQEDNQINVTELLLECSKTLFPLLQSTNIILDKALEFIVHQIYDALILKVLIINFLHQAILRTPNGGSIKLKSYISEGLVCIQIIDTGYDINHFKKLPKPPISLYSLPQNLLADLATFLNIKIKISYKNGTNIKLQIGSCPAATKNSIKEGTSNVITFPTKN